MIFRTRRKYSYGPHKNDRTKSVKRKYVTCTRCNRKSISVIPLPNSEQGFRCATFVTKNKNSSYLLCSYGSCFDGNVYEIIDTRRMMRGPICDSCIRDLERGRHAIRLVAEDAYIEWPDHIE